MMDPYIPPDLAQHLFSLGLTPSPRVVPVELEERKEQKPTGWMPAYHGEEPPF